MAIAKSILGKLRGKLGNLSCYEGRDGQTIVRSASVHRKASNMEQQRQETEFGTLSKVAAMLGYVLKTGFPKGKGVAAGSKGFLQANLKGGAVVAEEVDPGREFVRKGNAPRYFRGLVDYAKLQVAAGAVAVPEASVAEVVGETEKDGAGKATAVRRVRFRSEGRTRVGYDCFPEDRVHGVALCPSKKMRSMVEVGVRGETGEAEAEFDGKEWQGEVHFYAFATSADGKRASRSVYLGMMNW